MRTRSYSELVLLPTFEERYKYLAVHSRVGFATFGSDRWLNQRFYTSREWRDLRDYVIVRDNGCDLGVEGYEIFDKVYIHHMNPITVSEVESRESRILDAEFLITTTHRTHNAIHYGTNGFVPRSYKPRSPGDTKLW